MLCSELSPRSYLFRSSDVLCKALLQPCASTSLSLLKASLSTLIASLLDIFKHHNGFTVTS
jgi:hypothetical protein